MRIHKLIIKKVPLGYNPHKPLCGSNRDMVQMSPDWRFVTCPNCLKKKKGRKK